MKPTYGWYHRDPLTGEHLFHFSRYSRIEVINLVERAWDVIITVVSCDRNTINRRTNETQVLPGTIASPWVVELLKTHSKTKGRDAHRSQSLSRCSSVYLDDRESSSSAQTESRIPCTGRVT